MEKTGLADNRLISVIIPVFNREETIERCILSVCAQSYRNLEIIVVDDGSTDSTLQVIQRCQKKDSRIKLIRQMHGGPGAARNAGLDKCTGEYIGFVDSDDRILPKTYESLLALSDEYAADIACCNMMIVYDDNKEKLYKESKEGIVTFTRTEAMREIIEQKCFANEVTTKLFRKDVFRENRFRTDIIYEDAEIMPRLIFSANGVVYTGEPLYYYCSLNVSIIRSPFSGKRFDLEKAYTSRLDYIKIRYPEYYEISLLQYLGKAFYLLSASAGNKEFGWMREALTKAVLMRYKEAKGQVKFTLSIRGRCYALAIGLPVYDVMLKLNLFRKECGKAICYGKKRLNKRNDQNEGIG